MPSCIGTWASPVANRVPSDGWRCGFCHSRFFDWKKRVKHVRAHFDSGLDMQSWDLSFISTSLSRVSRRALQSPTLYGCSRCCRCFKTKRELSKHHQLPHLARTQWTCGDAYSALLSQIPELWSMLDFSVYFTGRTRCHHCGREEQPSEDLEDWMEWLRGHFLVKHNFGVCQESFPDADAFRSHLHKSHAIYPYTEIEAEVIGYESFKIRTFSFN